MDLDELKELLPRALPGLLGVLIILLLDSSELRMVGYQLTVAACFGLIGLSVWLIIRYWRGS
jgi:hypothetical protein